MIFVFGDFELDDARFELRRGGQKVAVQPKALDLLLHVVRHRHRVVPKQELLDHVWKGVIVTEAALSRVVMEARKAIEDQGSAESLQTSRGRGFRFAAPTREIGAAPAAESAVGPLAPAREAEAPPLPSTRDRTLALLPLRNLGPASDAWIADGLTDDLTDALCMIEGLRVRARGALRPYRDPLDDPREIGRKIGVQVVVEGSVRRVADHVRIAARLVNVEDGFQLWAGRFDCEVSEVLDISDQTARAIADALSNGRAAPQRAAPGDARAIELYLRAKHHMSAELAEGGLIEGLLSEAMARAPADPRILSEYAIWRVRDAFREGRDAAAISGAREVAERALEVAPLLGEPWVAMANVLYNSDDTPGAVRALRRAVSNAPSLAAAHELLGRILLEVGRVDDAIPYLERTLWLDPSVHFAVVDLARAHALRGAWRLAEQTMASLFAKSPAYHALLAARLAIWRGAPVAATHTSPRDVDPLVGRFNDMLARIFEERAFHADDRAFLAAVTGGSLPASRPRRLFHQIAAEVLAFVGEREEALQAVEGAVEEGLLDLSWMKLCPVLASVRLSPSFPGLLDRVAGRAATVVSAFLAIEGEEGSRPASAAARD